jgi:hypothetical protein
MSLAESLARRNQSLLRLTATARPSHVHAPYAGNNRLVEVTLKAQQSIRETVQRMIWLSKKEDEQPPKGFEKFFKKQDKSGDKKEAATTKKEEEKKKEEEAAQSEDEDATDKKKEAEKKAEASGPF